MHPSQQNRDDRTIDCTTEKAPTMPQSTLRRIAGSLYVEMIPDASLAPLFKGQHEDRLIDGFERMLDQLFADEMAPEVALRPDLCAPLTDRCLNSAQRMSAARVLIDCLLDAHLPADDILRALDRLYAILHGSATGRRRSAGAPRRLQLV